MLAYYFTPSYFLNTLRRLYSFLSLALWCVWMVFVTITLWFHLHVLNVGFRNKSQGFVLRFGLNLHLTASCTVFTRASSEIVTMSLRINTFHQLTSMQALPTVLFCRSSWFITKGFVIIFVKIADFFIFRQFQIASGTAFIKGRVKFDSFLEPCCVVWKTWST